MKFINDGTTDIDNQQFIKILGNYLFYGGIQGGEVYKRKAYFQGGWESKKRIYILELFDKTK